MDPTGHKNNKTPGLAGTDSFHMSRGQGASFKQERLKGYIDPMFFDQKI